MLTIVAMRSLGGILREIDHRCEQTDEEYAQDVDQVHAALMAHLNAELVKARRAKEAA